MIAYEVLVNGQRVCVASANAVLGVTLSWTPALKKGSRLSVGGMDKGEAGKEFVDWPVPDDVGLGDEITIRLIEADSVDEPLRRPCD